MRVSVTLSDDVNKLINERSKIEGLSKDKFIGSIIDMYLSGELVKVPNERGAGRKSKFSDDVICDIKSMRSEGCSIRQIAKTFDCSVGLVHKIIDEH